MNIFWIVLISLLPALGWFFLWRFQDKEKEPFRAMLLCFVFGMLATIPFFLLKSFPELIAGLHENLQTLILAFGEEIIKAILLILAVEFTHKWFTQIVDGLIYGAALALGFAFAENLSYLLELSTIDGSFIVVYLVRSLNTMVAHSLFTGLFGFFYATAYLNKAIFPKKKREKPWRHFLKNIGEALPFHITLMHLLPHRPSKHGHYPGVVILEGILVAGLLHAVFNLFLQVEYEGTKLAFLTYPLLFLIAYFVWRMFLVDLYTKIVKGMKAA
jgi:RsiW-degrading membrane proteinase PrsW (M82 family)